MEQERGKTEIVGGCGEELGGKVEMGEGKNVLDRFPGGL